VQELHLGDKVTVSFQLIDMTRSACAPIRRFATSTAGWPPRSETLSLHVDMAGPKVAAFPA
jgi:acyl-CoA thioester hydrolase